MSLKIKIKTKIKFPTNFDFTSELQSIARKVIIPLIKAGIETGTDIFGKRFPELEESTRKSKQRRGADHRALIDTTELYNSFTYRVKGRNRVLVFIKPSGTPARNEVAKYLQIEGVGRKKKKFHFFGVTDGMERDALVLMYKRLTRLLKNWK